MVFSTHIELSLLIFVIIANIVSLSEQLIEEYIMSEDAAHIKLVQVIKEGRKKKLKELEQKLKEELERQLELERERELA